MKQQEQPQEQRLYAQTKEGLQGITVRSVVLQSDLCEQCLRMADSKFINVNVCVASMADNQSPDA